MLVLNKPEITRLFPASIDEFQVEYLDTPGLKQRYSRTKQEFRVVGIEPMRNEGNLLAVRCSNYAVSVRKRKVILGVKGGWDVRWKYDPTSEKFVLLEVKPWWLQM